MSVLFRPSPLRPALNIQKGSTICLNLLGGSAVIVHICVLQMLFLNVVMVEHILYFERFCEPDLQCYRCNVTVKDDIVSLFLQMFDLLLCWITTRSIAHVYVSCVSDRQSGTLHWTDAISRFALSLPL